MNHHLRTAAMAFGLAGAAFAGGNLMSVAAAQDDAPSTTAPATEEAAPSDTDACRGPRRGPGLGAAAEAIGITAEDLRTALRDGQTIAEVAEANGVAVDTVIAAMVAEAEEHIAERVADGHLTQEEADEKLAQLEEHITDRVNGELPPRPGPRPGRDGETGQVPTPEAEGSAFAA